MGRDADLATLGRLRTLRPILWVLLAAFAGWVALDLTRAEMIPMFGLGFPGSLVPVGLWVFAAALCIAGFCKTSPKLWFVRMPLLIGLFIYMYFSITVFVRYQTFTRQTLMLYNKPDHRAPVANERPAGPDR